MRTPASGIPASRIVGDDDAAAAGRRARPARRGAELLEQHLGVKLSLSWFIRRTIRRERLGDVRGERRSPSAGATPRPGPCRRPRRRGATSASRSARAASSGGESAGQPCARSTTSAESGGDSPPTKHGFQPARHASRVEERLVAEDPPGDARIPRAADRRREAVEVGGGERRVAEALQHEVAVPDGPGRRADAVHLGVEAVPGPEPGQRRARDGELLVRGRSDGQRRVVREDDGCPSTGRPRARPSGRARATGALSAFVSFGLDRRRRRRPPRSSRPRRRATDDDDEQETRVSPAQP